VLILVGSFLEVYYYASRFSADGTGLILAYIIGVGLNLLLLMAVRTKKSAYRFLTIGLLAFSIISTSAGQTFALIQKTDSEQTARVAPQVDEIERENDELLKEREQINQQITGTVSTLEDRFEWKNTLALAESRKTVIETTLAENRKRVDALKNGTADTGRENVYRFYSRLLKNRVSQDSLKFILHTLLSLFIALMAPVGIITLENMGSDARKGPPDAFGKVLEPDNKPDSGKKMTKSEWVRFMWIGERQNKNALPSVRLMEECCRIAGISWDLELHNQYLEIAKARGLIGEDNKLMVKQAVAEKIMFF
jgi:hypothetical protein